MLCAKNISYEIGTKKILHNIHLDVVPGEVVAICGPNGAGKSSLLKVISGELKPSAGTVHVRDIELLQWDIKKLATIRAVLHQESFLSFPFLVEEVVHLGRYPYPKSTKNDVIVEECLEKVGMQSYKKRTYTSLSGGEKQRVHLARVLAQLEEESVIPKLLMLDEPTSALDLSHQEGTLHIASQYAKNNNYAVIVVLHDLNLAAAWSDRIIFLKEGMLHTQGAPSQVLTPEIISQIYNIKTRVLHHPDTNRPVIVVDRSSNT
ncbi:MAG: heme ABC transporter ATP-binding protein [Deltaproteobacteria bacterium]|nr:heme ABC transporter ATP-binding protein [Deltaproteobacteria bacterium]